MAINNKQVEFEVFWAIFSNPYIKSNSHLLLITQVIQILKLKKIHFNTQATLQKTKIKKKFIDQTITNCLNSTKTSLANTYT